MITDSLGLFHHTNIVAIELAAIVEISRGHAMRRLTIIVLTALLALGPSLFPGASSAAVPAAEAAVGSAHVNHRLLAVGAGAIVGIVVFNMLVYPLSSMPVVTGPLAATPVEAAFGSRFLAAIVGGAAALGAHYLYTTQFSQ